MVSLQANHGYLCVTCMLLLLWNLWFQLRHKWPVRDWDIWLRNSDQHQGRDCLYPEVTHLPAQYSSFSYLLSMSDVMQVPRVYHAGARGTFSDEKLYSKYFVNIAVNLDASIHWSPMDTAGTIVALLLNCVKCC